MRKVGCSSCARISINLAAAVAVIALVRHIVDVGAPGKALAQVTSCPT